MPHRCLFVAQVNRAALVASSAALHHCPSKARRGVAALTPKNHGRGNSGLHRDTSAIKLHASLGTARRRRGPYHADEGRELRGKLIVR